MLPQMALEGFPVWLDGRIERMLVLLQKLSEPGLVGQQQPMGSVAAAQAMLDGPGLLVDLLDQLWAEDYLHESMLAWNMNNMEIVVLAVDIYHRGRRGWWQAASIQFREETDLSSLQAEVPLILLGPLPLPPEEVLPVLASRPAGEVWVLLPPQAYQRAQQLLQWGADDVVFEDSPAVLLAARIEAYLRRYHGLRLGRRYGALFLEEVRLEAYLGSQALGLLPVEFRLLRTVIGAQGRLVPFTELWQHCTPGALAVHLHHLRRKLGGLASSLRVLRKRGVYWEEPPDLEAII